MSVTRYNFEVASQFKITDQIVYVEARPSKNGKYVRYSDYASLLASHNALREAIHKAMERTVGCDKKQTDDQLIADVAYLKRLASDHFKTSIDCGNSVFAAEQKYDALRDAVAWERECCQDIRPLVAWADLYARHGEDYVDAIAEELRDIQDTARAEVDRLIANEGAADCKGEG